MDRDMDQHISGSYMPYSKDIQSSQHIPDDSWVDYLDIQANMNKQLDRLCRGIDCLDHMVTVDIR